MNQITVSDGQIVDNSALKEALAFDSADAAACGCGSDNIYRDISRVLLQIERANIKSQASTIAWLVSNLDWILLRGKQPSKVLGAPKSGLPTGTVPIDEYGLSKDQIHDIKEDVGRGPKDWVGISPDGDVWVSGADGEAINEGSWKDYTQPNPKP